MMLLSKKPFLYGGRLVEVGRMVEVPEPMASDFVRYKLAEAVTEDSLTRAAEQTAQYLALTPRWKTSSGDHT